ncbi:MAG: hypothetical protein IJ443_00715 [Firmicutes bacterium]|nr:hypothetical protein [Bacillota bacterium]
MKKKKTTKGTKRTIFIYLLILVVLYVIIYIVPQVSDIFVETYTAEYGTLQVTDDATCLFVRNEKTYTAKSAGSVDRVVKSGRLMRSGAHIVDVGSTAYYSDMRGIISYYYDGLETAYTPETMTTITSAALSREKEEANPVKKAASGEAAAGDVVYKVVDNQKWYLLCWLKQDAIGKYRQGGTVIVDFKDGGKDGESTQLQMYIDALVPQGGETMLILSCNRHYKDFARYRTRECRLIASRTSGIFLETDSIVEKDGQKGVYVVDKLGNYNFTPVQILGQDGDVTVVTKNYFYDAEGYAVSTVQNYYTILRPEKEDAEKDAEKDAKKDAEKDAEKDAKKDAEKKE